MFARTKRLLLRPGWVDDAGPLAQAFGTNAVLTARQPIMSPEFIIFARKTTGLELVGGIGFHRASVGPTKSAELGFWIAEPHWGKGYATEAGEAVIAIARYCLQLRRVQAYYFVDNPASGRVLAKLGFTPTGQGAPRLSSGRSSAAPCVTMALDLARDNAGNFDNDTRMKLAA
jgi:RimJ/RimL family protein N-acetyltransferase